MQLRTWILCLAAAAGSSVLVLCDRRRLLERLAEAAEASAKAGPWGVAVFVVGFVLGTLLLVPQGPMEMAAGLLFARQYGLPGAVLLSLLAKQLAGSVAFLLGRTLLHDYVQKSVLPKFPLFKLALNAAQTEPFSVTCMVRFAPMPTTAKCLGLAACGVPYSTFLAASALFGAPWSAVSAGVGSGLASLPEALDGRGEQRLREALRAWQDKPLTLACMGLAGIAVSVFLCLKAWKLYRAYRELSKKAS
mmetsp:Transcript_85317/g.265172  ORF Transcript_85317/g.265172 Transcript_85317/m.265172 type:complete len:248 (-) Transcript_85317:127-870(-)